MNEKCEWVFFSERSVVSITIAGTSPINSRLIPTGHITDGSDYEALGWACSLRASTASFSAWRSPLPVGIICQ